MCRHLAYLGPPVTLRELIIDPPYGLAHQAWAPRRQRHGHVNVDGFGAGWYAGGDPVPARYRQAGPIWADANFADLSRVVRTGAALAAVRSASPGTAAGACAAAPFTTGRWLFSHNGVLNGWPAAAGRLAATLAGEDLLGLEARCDSALAWALVRRRLRAGAAPADALAAVIAECAAHGLTGRFNFLLSDGETIAATAAGDTLSYRAAAGACLVASEPCDDEPGWADVPQGSVLTGSAGSVEVRSLPPQDRPPPTEGVT